MMMSCIRDLELFESELLPRHDVMHSGLRKFQLQRNEWITNYRRNDGNESLLDNDGSSTVQLSDHDDVSKS